MKAFDRMLFVAGLVLLFGGLNIAILLSHTSRFVGFILIPIGIGLLLYALRGEKVSAKKPSRRKQNLATSIIDKLTLSGRLRPLIPVAGISVIIMVIAFNILRTGGLYLGSNDYVTLVLAGVLLVYNYIPERYSVERDFSLLFGILLFFLLVIPTTLLSLGGGEADTNTPLTYYLLVMPTAALVRLLGVDVTAPYIDPIYGDAVYNIMVIPGPDGISLNLSIALSCSGLYSVAIFVSAFIAFVAVEYRRFDRVVATLLLIGIVLAWIANILRMCIIVMVGRYYGGDAMVWTHNNIGELIFMAWVTLFWLLMFRRFGILDRNAPPKKKENPKKGMCLGCGKSLSPTMPSRKCACGAISHSECLDSLDGICPSCGVKVGAVAAEEL